jgi:hypothetical protein
MAKTERSPVVSQYVWLMRILGVVYALVGSLFFFFPAEIFYLMNIGPRLFPSLGLLEVPAQTESFWLVLATSMMMMLSALSFLASESPRIRGYALVHVLSKAVSVAGFFYMFLKGPQYAAYLVGITTDLPLLVVVTFTHLRAAAGAKN